MRRRPLESLGGLVRERRGSKKLREAAEEIGIGAATLLRVESGRTPDVATFGKICNWLRIAPGDFLGFEPDSSTTHVPQRLQPSAAFSAHFKADSAPKPETIKALARMLMLAANWNQGDPKE